VSGAAYNDTVQRLKLVEAQIEFFGSALLRQHYTSFLRELNAERRQLRASLEVQMNRSQGAKP
jgi:hypothetical protein